MNRPVFRSLQAHLRDATHDARWLRDEAATDGHRAAFEGCLFHLGQCTRIVNDVVDVDALVEQATVEAAQRDLDVLQLMAARSAATRAGEEWISLTSRASELYRQGDERTLADVRDLALIKARETGKPCRILARDGEVLGTVEP